MFCILFLILTWVYGRLYWTFGQKHFLVFGRQHGYLLVLKFWLITMKALLNIWCMRRGRVSLLSLHFINKEEMLTNISQLQVYYLSSPNLYIEGLYSRPQQSPVTGTADCQPPVTAGGKQRPCWLCSAAKGRAGRRLTWNCL